MAMRGRPAGPVGSGSAARAVCLAIVGATIALVPVAAFLVSPRLPHSFDILRYLILSQLFSDAIGGGAWYPRWIPDLNGGYGYPQFVFYQPGYFYLSHLFSFVDLPLTRGALALSTIALTGALGAYRLSRCFVSAPLGLFFMLMFQLTPFHFTELYARGDFSEWMVLQLSPWPLYFLYRLTRIGSRDRARPWLVLGLGASIAVLGYAHPVTYLAFLPALAMMACVVGGLGLPVGDRFAFFEGVGLAMLVGVALSAPYWLTVVVMKPHANIGAMARDPLAHVLSVVAFFWSDADALSQRLRLSFELGPVHFLLAMAGLWYGRTERFIFAGATVYVFLLLLMTPPLASIWSLYPFSLLQFPWRLLAVSAVFQLICMLGLAGFTRVVAWKRVAVCAVLVTVVVAWHRHAWTFAAMPRNALDSEAARRTIAANVPDGSAFLTFDVATPRAEDIRRAITNARRALPLRRFSTLDETEWLPITALPRPLTRPRGERFVDLLTGEASITPNGQTSAYTLDYLIDASCPSTVVIAQLYLPGWRVTVDGLDVSGAMLRDRVLPDGLMTVTLNPGHHRVRAWYGGPPGGWWRSLIVLVVVGGSTLWLFRGRGVPHDRGRP